MTEPGSNCRALASRMLPPKVSDCISMRARFYERSSPMTCSMAELAAAPVCDC